MYIIRMGIWNMPDVVAVVACEIRREMRYRPKGARLSYDLFMNLVIVQYALRSTSDSQF